MRHGESVTLTNIPFFLYKGFQKVGLGKGNTFLWLNKPYDPEVRLYLYDPEFELPVTRLFELVDREENCYGYLVRTGTHYKFASNYLLSLSGHAKDYSASELLTSTEYSQTARLDGFNICTLDVGVTVLTSKHTTLPKRLENK